MKLWVIALIAVIATLITPTGAAAQSDYGERLPSRDGHWLLPVATRLLGSTDDDHLQRGSINSWDLSATVGSPVWAAAPGVVEAAGCFLYENRQWPIMQGYGCAVQISHGAGVSSQYGHCLENSIRVKRGDRVDASTLLCQVGRTGKTAWPHTHFTILRNGSPVRIDSLFDIRQVHYCKFCNPTNDPQAPVVNGGNTMAAQPTTGTGESRLMQMLRNVARMPPEQLSSAVFVLTLLAGLILWLGGMWVRVVVISAGSAAVGALLIAFLLLPVTPVQAGQSTAMAGGDWEKAYQVTQGREGWQCTNDGAYTMGGVTQGTYNRWRTKHGMAPADVCKSLTREQAKAVFHEMFWLPIGADRLPFALALTAVDHYYNTGKVSHLLAQCGQDVACFNRARVADYRTKSNCYLYCVAWINRVNHIRTLTEN